MRDAILGRDPADVDVFWWVPQEWDGPLNDLECIRRVKEAGAISKFRPNYRRDDRFSGWSESRNFDEVLGVYLLHGPGGLDKQLVIMRGRRLDLSVFDFGLCMAAFDGRDVIRTPEFDADAAGERFTLLTCRGEHDLARSVARHRRWSDKYPGWPLVLGPQAAAVRMLHGRPDDEREVESVTLKVRRKFMLIPLPSQVLMGAVYGAGAV